ncbi:MAG: alcohol dehydrogenase catalytic domain-containing protein [Candidatus Aminicenantes bacterium]|nr:MAG: alcohol dehydrogenase catalytic domain-containing protein [Candidatus Aminicenantes bacterium]
MRVAMYYNNSDIRIEDMSRPVCGPGEMIMKVEASGICGSDVMEWYRIKKAPLVLGHEVSGEIVEVGKGVKNFKMGDRIVAAHHVPCNTCSYCLTGHHTACETLRQTNFDPGGFAEYIRLPAINVDRGVFKIPDDISYEQATFHEPLGCVLRALRVARLQPGQNVLVLGSGIAGLLMIHAARELGACRILSVDPVPFRLDMAKQFGADEAISPEEDPNAILHKITGGRLADLVVVCTGAEMAQYRALKSAERGGVILFFAFPDPEVQISFSVMDVFGRNGRTLTTSYGASPRDSWAALELMQSPAIRVKDMITHRLPLSETAKGFQLVEQALDSMKVIIEPQR